MKKRMIILMVTLLAAGFCGCAKMGKEIISGEETETHNSIEEKIENTSENDWKLLFRLITVIYQPDLDLKWSEQKGFSSPEELSSDSLF